MDRYVKYLGIIKKVDEAIEKQGMKLLEGKVTPENLDYMEKLLCLVDKAWKACWIVDRMDDINEGTRKIAEKGQGPDEGAMQTYAMGRGGGSGRDFRGGYPDSESETGFAGGHSARAWASPQGAYGMAHYPEEDRRGVKGTGRYSRYPRYRSEMDNYDMEEARRGRSARTGRFVHRAEGEGMDEMDLLPALGFTHIPGMGTWNHRMGYFGDPGMENNAMYNHYAPMNGIQVPVQNRQGSSGGSSGGNSGGSGGSTSASGTSGANSNTGGSAASAN